MTQYQKETIILALSGITDALTMYHNETIDYANKDVENYDLLVKTENIFFNTNIDRINKIAAIIREI